MSLMDQGPMLAYARRPYGQVSDAFLWRQALGSWLTEKAFSKAT